MDDKARNLDPEMAGLLREIAQDRNAALLSAPTLGEIPGLAALREPVVTISRSKAERHLLQVYREEVAYLLRQASGIAMRKDPRSTIVMHVGVEDRLEVLGENALGSETKRVKVQAKHLEGVAELDALEDSMPILTGSGSRWAAASLRVLPRTDTRIYLATALVREGHSHEAMQMLNEIVQEQPSALNLSLTRSSMGTIHFNAGRFREARDSHRIACESADFPLALMGWLLNSCQIGDKNDAIHAMERVDEVLVGHASALEECLHVARSVFLVGSPQFLATASALRDRAGSASMRILNV